MKKLFFENEDAENCYPEAYFQQKMKDEELTELTVLEANKSKEKEYIYCTSIGECGESSSCGKECEDYEPRNAKNGCCKHRRAIYEHGEEVTLKRKRIISKPSFNAELILTLESKNEWVRKVPHHLPEKNYRNEQFIWIDANGNTLVMGEDFAAAERIKSYPVKVYRHIRVTDAEKVKTK